MNGSRIVSPSLLHDMIWSVGSSNGNVAVCVPTFVEDFISQTLCLLPNLFISHSAFEYSIKSPFLEVRLDLFLFNIFSSHSNPSKCRFSNLSFFSSSL